MEANPATTAFTSNNNANNSFNSNNDNGNPNAISQNDNDDGSSNNNNDNGERQAAPPSPLSILANLPTPSTILSSLANNSSNKNNDNNDRRVAAPPPYSPPLNPPSPSPNTSSLPNTNSNNSSNDPASKARKNTVFVAFPRKPQNKVKPYSRALLCRHSFIISHALNNPTKNFFETILDTFVDGTGLSHIVLKNATGDSFESVLDHLARVAGPPRDGKSESDRIGSEFPEVKLGMAAQVWRAARLLAVEPLVAEMEKRMMGEMKRVPMPVWKEVLEAWGVCGKDTDVPRQIIAEGVAERVAEEVFVRNLDGVFAGEVRVWGKIFGEGKYAAIPGLQNAVTEKYQRKRELMLMCMPTPH